METADAVTCATGGKPGVPDIWTSAIGLLPAATSQTARPPADRPAGDRVPGRSDQADAATLDPALVREIAKRIDEILAAAPAAGIVLARGENMSAVRAGLDEICEQAAQARRALGAGNRPGS